MISKQVSSNIFRTQGRNGEAWIKAFPDELAQILGRWGFELKVPLEKSSLFWLGRVKSPDGSSAILKAGFPDDEWLCHIRALQDFQGTGTVACLKADIESGFMLMEEAQPGEDLLMIPSSEHPAVIAGVVEKLHSAKTPSEGYPSILDWAKSLDTDATPFAANMVESAKSIFAELAKASPWVLLHGDLHHYNVLSATREPWLAIDPKGILGPPEYELGAFLRNPYPGFVKDPSWKKIQERRVDFFVDHFGYTKEVINLWGFAQAVLAAVWSYEAKDPGWKYFIEIAENHKR